MAPLECRNSGARLAGLLILELALIALCVWSLAQPGLMVRAAGAVGLPLFALGLYVIPRQWLRRGPQLIIDDHGIEDRRVPDGRIAWSEIRSIHLASVFSSHFLCIDLVDPVPRSARLSGWRRRLQAPNRAMGYGDVTLSTSGLTPGIAAVWQHLQERNAAQAESDPAND